MLTRMVINVYDTRRINRSLLKKIFLKRKPNVCRMFGIYNDGDDRNIIRLGDCFPFFSNLGDLKQ